MKQEAMSEQVKSNRSGRPPKFREPRRPVTMTLPERILDLLAEIDPDRAQAVAKAAEAVAGAEADRFKPVKLTEMAQGKSLIVVGPSKALKEIPWLKLIEIAPTRFLLSIPSGTPVEALEVALRDLTNDPVIRNNDRETAILAELLSLIGHQRRMNRLGKAEFLIIDTE